MSARGRFVTVEGIDGAGKSSHLEFLCERLGCDAADAVAIGDGRNDRPMLEWAGLAVAVESAPAEVRAAADRLIGPPGSGGIARLVGELLNGERP